METRAYYIQGLVGREIDSFLGNGTRRISQVPLSEILANDTHPSLVSAAGGTYEQVWARVAQHSIADGRPPLAIAPFRLASNAVL